MRKCSECGADSLKSRCDGKCNSDYMAAYRAKKKADMAKPIPTDSIAALPKEDRLALAKAALELGEDRGKDTDVRAEPVEAISLKPEVKASESVDPVDELPQGSVRVYPSGRIEDDPEVVARVKKRNPLSEPWTRRQFPNRLPDDYVKPAKRFKWEFHPEKKTMGGAKWVKPELSLRVQAHLAEAKSNFEKRRHEDVTPVKD